MTGPDETLRGSTTNGSREEPLDRALGRASDAPLRPGNRLTLLRNGPETFDEWMEKIGLAEKWIHLELF
jgi:cardiolipin synthase A/B